MKKTDIFMVYSVLKARIRRAVIFLRQLQLAGIVRTKDFKTGRGCQTLRHSGQIPQQRNVVLHPYFVNGKYVLYRLMDDFIETGSGGE